MRVVREIHHPECKITIFAWNNRYLIKLEQGMLEQTFKINELDLSKEEDVDSIINDPPFIEDCIKRFKEMSDSLFKTLQKLN